MKATMIMATAVTCALGLVPAAWAGGENHTLYDVEELNAEFGVDAPENSTSTLTVTGFAVRHLEVELLTVRFGAENISPSPIQALANNTATMNGIISALVEIGIPSDDIRTANFHMSAQYDYDPENNKEVFRGYRVFNEVVVESDRVDEAGLIIETAIGSGAERVRSLEFGASAETRAAAFGELLTEATEDAFSKAQIILDTIDYRILGIDGISVLGSAGGDPDYLYAFADFALASGGPPISAGDTTIGAGVNVVFVIGPK